jgi:hypothetical protein
MKKKVTLALVVLFAIGMSALAQPSPIDAAIPVNAYVGQVFQLIVPIDSYWAYLDPTVGANWDFGDITVRSNVNNWTLSISSQRVGQLFLPGIHPIRPLAEAQPEPQPIQPQPVDIPDEYIPYKIVLTGGLDQTISTSDFNNGKFTLGPYPATDAAGFVFDFSIQIDPISSALHFYRSGLYTDVLTLTLAAN